MNFEGEGGTRRRRKPRDGRDLRHVRGGMMRGWKVGSGQAKLVYPEKLAKMEKRTEKEEKRANGQRERPILAKFGREKGQIGAIVPQKMEGKDKNGEQSFWSQKK